MSHIVIGILGQRLDHLGYGKRRWLRWRPTMSLLMQHDFQVDELVLLYHKDDERLLALTTKDAQEICLNIKVTSYMLDYDDPWDFEQVYSQLHDFSLTYPFLTLRTINITSILRQVPMSHRFVSIY